MVLAGAVSAPTSAQSSAKLKVAWDRSWRDASCAEGRIICIPKSETNSLIGNPFRVDVQVNSDLDIFIAWEIRDSTGQVLESSSTYDYNVGPTQDFTLGRVFHIVAFIFTPSKSSRGTLTLTPSRYTIQTGGVNLPGLTIPVRLSTAKSTVTTLEPANPAELTNAVIDRMDRSEGGDFNPRLKLVERKTEIMQLDQTAIIAATVEAVLRLSPGQSPWHITHWRRSGSTAHVTLVGGGWAGSSYYGAEVGYLMRKSALHLPGIKDLVFDNLHRFGN
jgi:hypothetical protein